MRPPAIVMVNEYGQRALQMPCAQDQEPIQALGSSDAHEPLCDPIRPGYLNRRPNDSDVFGLEYGIEAACELAIVIADQKTNRFRPFGQRLGHLPRLLRDPFGVGVGRAPGKMDAPAGDLDEEQHVQPLEPTPASTCQAASITPPSGMNQSGVIVGIFRSRFGDPSRGVIPMKTI